MQAGCIVGQGIEGMAAELIQDAGNLVVVYACLQWLLHALLRSASLGKDGRALVLEYAAWASNLETVRTGIAVEGRMTSRQSCSLWVEAAKCFGLLWNQAFKLVVWRRKSADWLLVMHQHQYCLRIPTWEYSHLAMSKPQPSCKGSLAC